MAFIFSELKNEVKRRSTTDQGGTQFDAAIKNIINKISIIKKLLILSTGSAGIVSKGIVCINILNFYYRNRLSKDFPIILTTIFQICIPHNRSV